MFTFESCLPARADDTAHAHLLGTKITAGYLMNRPSEVNNMGDSRKNL